MPSFCGGCRRNFFLLALWTTISALSRNVNGGQRRVALRGSILRRQHHAHALACAPPRRYGIGARNHVSDIASWFAASLSPCVCRITRLHRVEIMANQCARARASARLRMRAAAALTLHAVRVAHKLYRKTRATNIISSAVSASVCARSSRLRARFHDQHESGESKKHQRMAKMAGMAKEKKTKSVAHQHRTAWRKNGVA